MSLVDADTGEIVEVMPREEASHLTDRIRSGLGVMWELVEEAYRRRAWLSLGYESWDAYCFTEFGSSHLKLPREDRREVVASLRDAGLSQRAIAAATGVSQGTVRTDLSGEQNCSPEDAYDLRPETQTVTGTDGKSYSATRSQSKRSPLLKDVTTAGWNLRKAAERLEGIAADDRWASNKPQIADQLTEHLEHALMVAQTLLDDLTT